MINKLHSLVRRVESGWDPISIKYALSYSSRLGVVDARVVTVVENWLGGFDNRSVLDLGGGPGHYAVEFARRGARVTWHDPSRNYARIVQERAALAGVEIECSLGYLEAACKFKRNPFSLVFCRRSWCYCIDERKFAGLLYNLVAPGGVVYIECDTPEASTPTGWTYLRSIAYLRLGVRIGHPFPKHGRIARLMQRYPIQEMWLDYRDATLDIVVLRKSNVAT
jgi:SAM-dependent methyltransferase